LNKRIKIVLIAAGVMVPVLFAPLPRFGNPLSTVVEARDGTLLGARIADDGQWRFPEADSIPEKFEKALLTFEDRYFYYHPGINPVAILRALVTNIKAGRVVLGGSTISMQVARIARGNKPRSYLEKAIEMLSSLKLELLRSKKKILLMYTGNSPFGGNTVGLEAAAWRYTGKSPANLTWAEAAALAILPNSPSLVYPGKNQEILRTKRDDLLRKMYRRGFLDSLTLLLSIDEPLPGEPKKLPSYAPHLTDYFFKNSRGKRIRTTVDPVLQQSVSDIVNTHQKELENNFIFNSACLVVDVKTGNVLAYVGNSTLDEASQHGGDVDIIRSSRSTGSILKPLIYAGMQQAGDILPNTLVADIPTRFQGFSPKNFDQSFSGAVPAGSALSQSLNIPAVRMLQEFSPEKFLELLKKTGFTTFVKPADYYGLSLILGGGETSLWELTGVYASLSRVLCSYNREEKYFKEDYHPPVIVQDISMEKEISEDPVPPLTSSAIWLTYEALQKVNRPESETGWQYFSSSPNLAWKTGTSFGFRDGWAVGTTPEYVVGVWTGNADGEGRPGLTGTTAAAPVLFDIVNMMGAETWFSMPSEELTSVRVCSKSGYRAGPDCPETMEIFACTNGLRSGMCPYHRIIHLNRERTFRVNSGCISPDEIVNESWFVLPPAMEYFYKQKHSGYQVLPPVEPGCSTDRNIPVMEFIYPTLGIKIYIPRDQTGMPTRIIPEVAHRNPSKRIYWHLDQKYVTTTRYIHQIDILAGAGDHLITVVDEDGNSIRTTFTITGKN
jgi:penicillin-binding protein 1C